MDRRRSASIGVEHRRFGVRQLGTGYGDGSSR